MRPQAAKSDLVFIARQNNEVIAALRLCDNDNIWLLRSMCVAEACRGQGVGSFMLLHLNKVFSEKTVYCFPYVHLQDFYQRAGFIDIPLEAAPEMIRQQFNRYADKGKKIVLMKYSG